MKGTYSKKLPSIIKNPKISIIILNWNGWKDTLECLESLYKIDYPNFEVIIADNGSSDESVKKIKSWAIGTEKIESKFFKYDKKNKPINCIDYTMTDLNDGTYQTKKEQLNKLPSKEKLFIFRNDKNYGFAEGNNIAIRQVVKENKSKYILLLNNDMIVEKDFLSNLIVEFNSSLNISSVTSKILYYYDPSLINSAGDLVSLDGSGIGRFRYQKDVGQCGIKEEVFSGTGGCTLYKLNALEKVTIKNEYLDKDFFCYNEDLDLGWRLRVNGYVCMYAPSSVVYHKHSSTSKQYSIFKVYYGERNRLLTMFKNYSLNQIVFGELFYILKLINLFLLSSIKKGNKGAKYLKSNGIILTTKTLLKANRDAFLLFNKMRKKKKLLFKKNKRELSLKSYFFYYKRFGISIRDNI